MLIGRQDHKLHRNCPFENSVHIPASSTQYRRCRFLVDISIHLVKRQLDYPGRSTQKDGFKIGEGPNAKSIPSYARGCMTCDVMRLSRANTRN
jgi:hypothetical protein